ncbi:Glyoxalase-like domain protein [compost metagenome]
MQKLKKIDAHTNVLTWFEIPVLNTLRAKSFYEEILDLKMTIRSFPDSEEELTFFSYDPNVIQATSGRITGVLTKSPNKKPSRSGVLIYINAYLEIQLVLDRVIAAGGKIILSKTLIPAGYIAVIEDTEGNHIGLSSEK